MVAPFCLAEGGLPCSNTLQYEATLFHPLISYLFLYSALKHHIGEDASRLSPFLLVDGGLPSSVQENLEQLKFVFFQNKGYNIITRLGVMAPA